jgi:hypothetical protein
MKTAKKILSLYAAYILAFALSSLTANAQTLVSQRAPEKSTTGDKYVYFNFVVNCHDFTNVDESVRVLNRLRDIFTKYGVKADFYFIDQLVQRISWKYPTFFTDLKAAGMGIGMHHRAPHPVDFRSSTQSSLERMPWDNLLAEVTKWETQRLNITTPTAPLSNTGGIALLKQLWGDTPTIMSEGGGDGIDRLPDAIITAAKTQGMRTILGGHHESGSDNDYPIVWSQGMVARVVDSSITRWSRSGKNTAGSCGGTVTQDTQIFWWEAIGTSNESLYLPYKRIADQMQTVSKSHLTYYNAILHETDFHYTLPPWRAIYFSDSCSTQTRTAPFDTTRSNAERWAKETPWIAYALAATEESMWRKYDSLVATVAQHPNIRTMRVKDLLDRIVDDRERAITREHLKQIASTILTTSRDCPVAVGTRKQQAAFPPRFFVLGTSPGNDFFSLADAFYAMNAALATFAKTGVLPASLNLKDINGPVDTVLSTTGLQSAQTLAWSDVVAAVNTQDASFATQTARNKYNGRIPNALTLAGKTANPLEYLYMLAAAYQAVEANSTAPSSVKAEAISYLCSSGSRAVLNTGSKWTEKPARLLAATTTGVSDNTGAISMGARLEPISPNPATDQATVSFTLTQREHATLKLYNALGVEVASLLDAEMIAGEHSLPVSLSAIALPQGAYFLRLQTPTFSTTKPVQVLR